MSMDNSSIKRNIGLFALGCTGTAAVGLVALSFPFVLPALRKICLPYIPATDTQLRNVMNALKNTSGNMIDLGSGDGRIVLKAAEVGFKAHGIELNPWLVLFSRFKAFNLGLHKCAIFRKRDIWKTNLKDYDNVVIFGVDQMMHDLEDKFSKELKTGSYVIACRFKLPHWEPVKTIGYGIDTVWLYKKL